jgi:glycosyltransferase involved in cell wall biosynthesis
LNQEDLELSIVLPCLNEEETLEKCLLDAFSFLEINGIKGEVIVGDNGSIDRSCEIAQRCGARVVSVSQKGYGSVLIHSISKARSSFIIMGDADDSYDFSSLLPFIEKLREGHDLVIGNRFQGGILPGAMPWKNRWVGNPFLSGVGRFFFGSKVGDFHCGLRGFRRESFERLSLKCLGMEFASEMVIKASLLSMRITEVPVVLRKDGRSRPSHLRPWRDGWRHLRLMLLLGPRWIFLAPGILFFLSGLTLSLLLVTGPIRIGVQHFDVNTLIASGSLILIGFQFISFSFLSKIFAIREGLLIEDPLLTHFFKFLNLEKGLLMGGILFLLGVMGFGWIFFHLGSAGFDQLDLQSKVRLVYSSIIFLVLGFQIVLTSFFLSFLGLDKIKEDST